MWRITTAHSPHLLLSQFCNSHAPFSATSFPDWNILLSVQFPNFLEGLFFIFCNSSVYSLSSGWGDQAHRAVLHMWVSQGFQDHAQHPLSCSHHPDDGNIGGFLAAAANRKDLRISTNSSLKSLSAPASSEFCFMQSQFDNSQPPRPSTTHTATVKLPEIISIGIITWRPQSTTQKHGNYLRAFLTLQHKGNAG